MKKIVVYIRNRLFLEDINSTYTGTYFIYFLLYEDEIDHYKKNKTAMELINICFNECVCLSEAIKKDFKIKIYSSSKYIFMDSNLLTYDEFYYFYLHMNLKLHASIVDLFDYILFSWQ